MKTKGKDKGGENLEILSDNLKLLSSQYSAMGSKSDFLKEQLERFSKGLEEEIEQRKLGIYPNFETSKANEEDAVKAA